MAIRTQNVGALVIQVELPATRWRDGRVVDKDAGFPDKTEGRGTEELKSLCPIAVCVIRSRLQRDKRCLFVRIVLFCK